MGQFPFSLNLLRVFPRYRSAQLYIPIMPLSVQYSRVGLRQNFILSSLETFLAILVSRKNKSMDSETYGLTLTTLIDTFATEVKNGIKTFFSSNELSRSEIILFVRTFSFL
jgi:hypothetical protein